MNELFGFTRTVVKSRYALLTPDGFVPSNLSGWKNCIAVVNISPAMGAKFSQLQITFGENGEAEGNTGLLENFIYVLEGKCAAKIGGGKFNLVAGSFVFVPPEKDFYFGAVFEGTRLLCRWRAQKNCRSLPAMKKKFPASRFLAMKMRDCRRCCLTKRSLIWR